MICPVRVLFGLSIFATLASPLARAAEVDFEREVKPLFRENCLGCHGASQQMGSLRLDVRDLALIAGRGKMAIVPGGSDRSLVYLRVAGTTQGPQMPPTGKLTPEQINTIKDWIDQGARWPADPPRQRDWTPDSRLGKLFENIRKGDFATVRKAVEADPALAKARDTRGTTLLMRSALYGTKEAVRFLLDHGADSKAQNDTGSTALMWAIDDTAKTEALLAKGADPDAHSVDGRTALILATDVKHNPGVIGALLKAGAKVAPESGQVDPLVQVSRNGDLESMKLLFAKRGAFPPAALTSAALADCRECFDLVLANTTNKTAVSDALRGSATLARVEYLERLIAAGADVNAKDGTGTTALLRASYFDGADPVRVKLLLDHGADVAVRDQDGDTALRKALRKGHTQVVDLLLQAGAKE
jgi:ankyrin repeat protein/mono/diheme cytochrome c family protein